VIRNEKKDPVSAARALRELGESNEAATLLLDNGHETEAAEEYLHAQNPVAAAQIFERAKHYERAIEIYTRAGLIDRAAKVAFDHERFEEAGHLFARARQLDRALDAFRKASKPILASSVLEGAGRHFDAAQELAAALKNPQALKRVSVEERRTLLRHAAELFERAGKGLRAAPLFEEAGEPVRALELYAQHANYDDAARIALARKDHDRASELFRLGKKPKDAARARAESFLAHGDRLAAARELEAAGETEQAGELYEDAQALAEAGRCFDLTGDLTRAASLFVRAGDPARAAILYERAEAWREAAAAWQKVGDRRKAARAHERAEEPVAAAEAFLAGDEPAEAMRVLSTVARGSSVWRRARAVLGDVHTAAGRDEEAAKAYAEAFPPDARVDADAAPRLLRHAGVLANLARFDEARSILERLKGTPHAPKDLAVRIAGLSQPTRTASGRLPTPRKSTGGRVRSENEIAEADPHALVGTDIDRYRVLAFVGEGSTAWVYRAEHAFLKRTVALKLAKPRSRSADYESRFLAAGQAVASLRHPNVIEVYDCGVTPRGALWIALEFVPGLSLRELLKKAGTLPVPRAARVGAGVLAGLAASHAAGIVHGDLKPENVLLGPGERAKVVDFGLAHALAPPHDATHPTFEGNPRYYSPEQAQGQEAVPASDQYACGLVLYEMLSGHTPFECEKAADYLPKHASDPAPPLLERAREVPPALAEAIQRSLAKAPADRHPSAEAFRRSVVAFAPRSSSPSQSTSGD
jgi:serine/threonine-protein kinase